VYQYDPEAYRQLYDEKMAELRRDYQGAQGRPRSSAAERCIQSVRSVRLAPALALAASRTYLDQVLLAWRG